MAGEKRQILIESILGGVSEYGYLAGGDEFLFSLGIDPYLPPISSVTDLKFPSGGIRPVAVSNITSTVTGYPTWFITNPKTTSVFVYDSVGSVYSTDLSTVSDLGDLNDGGSATGNGAAYHDNYVYFSRDTTVARYGPLNGSPSFTDDYWVSTLGKAALTNTTYPTATSNVSFPNHILHRHNNGKLYIADVVGNQGTLHYISTTKTTVEGDTDNGSTFNDLDLPYGYWPTSMESYGDQLVITLYEGSNSNSITQSRAKIAFWDTVNENVTAIIDHQFPDAIIGRVINVGGTLYFFSGHPGMRGLRISQYVGGESFRQIQYLPKCGIPIHGAVDQELDTIIFGSGEEANLGKPSVWGLQLESGSPKLHSLLSTSSATGNNNDAAISTVKYVRSSSNYAGQDPLVGWYRGAGNGIDIRHSESGTGILFLGKWRSQYYRVGRPFKITKIFIPFYDSIGAGMSCDVGLGVDSDVSPTSIITVSSTNYSGLKSVRLQPPAWTGEHSFFLQLDFSASTELMVAMLPIAIEYEIIGD